MSEFFDDLGHFVVRLALHELQSVLPEKIEEPCWIRARFLWSVIDIPLESCSILLFRDRITRIDDPITE